MKAPVDPEVDHQDHEASAPQLTDAKLDSEPDPEVDPEHESVMRLCRLTTSIGWLDAEVLSDAMKALPLGLQRGMLQRYGIQVEPRFAKGGVGALLRPRLRRTPAKELFEDFCPTILGPIYQRMTEVHGEDWPEEIVTLDLEDLTAELRHAYPNELVRLFVAKESFDNPESDELLAFLRCDPVLGAHDDVFRIGTESFLEGRRMPAPSLEPLETDDDAGSAPQEEDAPGLDDPPEATQELFSPLDALLIRTAVATHTATVGAPDAEGLRVLVDEFVHLNSGRPSSYFHVGFLSALDTAAPGPDLAGMNEERWRWYRFGRLSGLVRRGQVELLEAELLVGLEDFIPALSDPLMGRSVLAAAVDSVLVDRPQVAARLLSDGPNRFAHDERCCRSVYEHARSLISEQHAAEAEVLFAALSLRAEETPGLDPLDVARRLAACRRALGDFPGARSILDAAETSDGEFQTDARVAAVVAVESGLIEAGVAYLSQLTFPLTDADVESVAARVRRGAPSFHEALRRDASEPRASYLLGVLASCEGDFDAAAALLEVAESGMAGDDIFERTGVLSGVRFHRAVAVLSQLQPGTDSVAFDALRRSLEEGYRPSSYETRQAADALAAHKSRHTGEFLLEACERSSSLEGIAPLIVRAAETADRHAMDLAAKIAKQPRVSVRERLDVLVAAAQGALLLGDVNMAEDLVEHASNIVEEAGLLDLDRSWAELLASSEVVRTVLGALQADAERVESLRRVGEYELARATAELIFHRVVNGQSFEFDPAEILELLRELGESTGRLEDFQRRIQLPSAESDNDQVAMEGRHVEVVFVGGNETQAQYRDAIDEEMARRYGDGVTVKWHFSGWSSNWAKFADRAEADLAVADVLVLMTLVRTNLGRRLRKRSGELDRPWVSCTGHGRAALIRAIERAVEIAALDDPAPT